MAFLVRLLALALAFNFILPVIPGIEVQGGFLVSLGLALLFCILALVVNALATALTAILTVGTLGMALLVLIPLWILGFWLIPALVLMLTSDIMPQYLQITGWSPAIIGGLITLVIGILTAPFKENRVAA